MWFNLSRSIYLDTIRAESINVRIIDEIDAKQIDDT